MGTKSGLHTAFNERWVIFSTKHHATVSENVQSWDFWYSIITGHHCRRPPRPSRISSCCLKFKTKSAIQTIHCKNRTRDRVYHCCCQAAHDAWPPSLFSASVQILDRMLPTVTFKKTWLQLVPLHHWFNTIKITLYTLRSARHKELVNQQFDFSRNSILVFPNWF